MDPSEWVVSTLVSGPSEDTTNAVHGGHHEGEDAQGDAFKEALIRPFWLAFDPLRNRLFVSDMNCIRLVTIGDDPPRTTRVHTLAGAQEAGAVDANVGKDARFTSPAGLALDAQADVLYVACGSNKIRAINVNTCSSLPLALAMRPPFDRANPRLICS